MGSSPSKAGGGDEEALALCKERLRCIRLAIDSREALSAAHLSYTHSLRSVGTALRRYAESTNLTTDSETAGSSLMLTGTSNEGASSEQVQAKVEEGHTKRESHTQTQDPSELVTHGAKDFVSSMKEIETCFISAAEAGNEVSRMLETNKIRVDACAEIPGSPGKPTARFVSAFSVCCNRQVLVNQETTQHVSSVVTSKRPVSTLSSSSKIPLTTSMIQDDVDDSNNDFVEQFAMVFGSHSSTLDRLQAWETKLYDEIKHQLARGLDAELIDKTRAVAEDLDSRASGAIQAVDGTLKRIRKIRDGELLPQLVELIQGLIRMWRAMLECHHKQFITVSLAYHVKSSTSVQQGEHHHQAAMQLWNEMDCFSSALKILVTAQFSYADDLHTWLGYFMKPPRPHRHRPKLRLLPPIFTICYGWANMRHSLSTGELCKSIKDIVQLLHDSYEHQIDQTKQISEARSSSGSQERGMLENNEQESSRGVSVVERLQSKLTTVLDRLAKYAEGSMKLHEEANQNYKMCHDRYYLSDMAKVRC